MGNRVTKFEFIPRENEEIEANIIVPKETRSIIHGVVRHNDGGVLKGAVVRLFEINFKNENSLKPVANAFTDESGEFLFGPLCTKKHYVIKVWSNSNKIKELVITPDEFYDNEEIFKEIKSTYEKRDGGLYYMSKRNKEYYEENQ